MRPVRLVADQQEALVSLQSVAVPDLWQQQAVGALRAGKDVVVQAPTGSGKTLVFELWSNQGRPRGQAIYTVPTRALANDKLAEWRARGWNVGIATGDLAENLSAPVIVATLETQKNRLIQGEGPCLLVVDEYQMIADEHRGLNYELALALAPERTQLLLLSGSVANPHQIVQWFNRLGREAVLVRHEHRPVPLEEVVVGTLDGHLPSEIRGYWPRFCAKALAESLGPILLFAPRRANAEEIAADIARQLPCPSPLVLSDAQKRIAGEHLAKMLKSRVAYHHSGLSYAARAGVIEPLAKAGQLRVVVATMGLAAGINFSLRSVAITEATYKRDRMEFPLRSDEILQMYGRAGRRGIDEVGYVLVGANELRLRDGCSAHLARNGMVDWSALLSLMAAAADLGKEPFAEAIRVQERLFTTKPIFLGVEQSLRHPDAPCELKTDAERARHVHKRMREFLNSRSEWEAWNKTHDVPLGAIRAGAFHRHTGSGTTTDLASSAISAAGVDRSGLEAGECLVPVLTIPAAVEKIGSGGLAVLSEGPDGKIWGRSMILADRLADGHMNLAKWVRRLTNWTGRLTTAQGWRELVVPIIEREMARQRLPVLRIEENATHSVALVSLAEQTLRVPIDRHGVAVWKPREREVFPQDCARCSWIEECKKLGSGTGTALLWRRLLLVDARGVPTLRGRVVSFFAAGDGLAVAAALEEGHYPLEDLVYDLANLDAGFRFCREEDRWAGRIPVVCHQRYGNQNIAGYIENGIPLKYGSGAEVVVRSVHEDPASKHRFTTQFLGDGDIDRVIIEWRSLLRQIANAPALEWERWSGLQKLARSLLKQTESPTATDLPGLEYGQTRRVDHRLVLRRH